MEIILEVFIFIQFLFLKKIIQILHILNAIKLYSLIL